MGLANMALVQNAVSGHGSDDDKTFFAMVVEQGLGKALEFRQTNSDDSITQI